MIKQTSTSLLLVFFCVSASAQIIRDVEALTPDARVAYGSLQLYEEGELMKRSARRQFYLLILPADSKGAVAYKVNREQSGEFFINLDPGDYTLLGYHWIYKGFVTTNHIEADFSVPAAGGDVYIGSIDIHSGALGDMLVLEDRFDEISLSYDARFPERQGTSMRQLMREWEPTGDYEHVTHPCQADWQIDCEGRFQGVVPITPPVTRQGFPLADSLTPRFSWEASPLDGVTYDFILYEAATYGLSRTGKLIRTEIRGRVAAYQQNLREPYWQADTPLEPGTRYYWSVRFRDGPTVSEWSTHSHFFTIIIATSAAYGQWFQFETPGGSRRPSGAERLRSRMQ